MLSATRVIGHREYGNTPPGGWAGRKTDPVYDMNWRRARVASFRPVLEDDMPDEATFKRWVREATWTASYNEKGVEGAGPGFVHMKDRVIWSDIKTGGIAAAVSQLLAAGGQGAAQIAAALRPIILDAVEQGMAADNNDTADQIAARIAAKLAAPTP
jgi:hypothetical protein